ncbi:MAG: heme exporter protein CcmB [Acidimicrobiia bacterium]
MTATAAPADSTLGFVRASALVAKKDLRVELRSKVALAQVLPFGAIVVVLFAFALDPDRGVLPRVAPGLFWITVLLAALLAVGRSISVELRNRSFDALRLSGIDGAAVFTGKCVALVLELLALEVLLGVTVVVLYDIKVAPSAAGILVLAALAATVGIAAVGTAYGALAAGARTRETLLPLLVLPLVAPVMLGGTRSFESALGDSPADAWPWVALLTVFAALFASIGVLSYGTLMEETS